ncbi:ankyrin repeat protein, protein phosphatase regulatory subunit, PPP1R16A-like protein [Schizosaccharomyces osmophilus]|uniref:Ankyrin repeat protein, protein phosphatase regulatory subunit, PPP1R16A-like protein n=1 Tax=Schizosaccharomyces osmophilus TaxID=2545709 RepID=A0AAE9W9A9_9SCHI|nr:ankyrin repeat protein, protein phosphatase regulatory subunit, PPP1R16A-like protein [Schizosaccharomyces osmophilus]WBW72045.1 ankyrin repeat protein, protein phosphatase regulatory subunit, PPP1R16A-like protein [Schizosaccharomyces osmophilus]
MSTAGATPQETLVAACRTDNVDMLAEAVHGQEGHEVEFINQARDSLGNDCLHVCAKYGSVNCLDWILDISGIELNHHSRMTGDTPLHLSVAYLKKNEEISLQMVEMLIEVGADSLATNNDGFRPIDLVPGDYRERFGAALEGPAPTLQYSADAVADDDDDDDEGEGSGSE